MQYLFQAFLISQYNQMCLLGREPLVLAPHRRATHNLSHVSGDLPTKFKLSLEAHGELCRFAVHQNDWVTFSCDEIEPVSLLIFLMFLLNFPVTVHDLDGVKKKNTNAAWLDALGWDDFMIYPLWL